MQIGNWDWQGVIVCAFFSLFSWIGAFAGVMMILQEWITNKDFKTKPPKFL
jgi:hypothetical protein